MTDANHTPGPWEAVGTRVRVVGPGVHIAGCDGPLDAEERRANAHLIAAAPDLYLALNAIALADDWRQREDIRQVVAHALLTARGYSPKRPPVFDRAATAEDFRRTLDVVTDENDSFAKPDGPEAGGQQG